MTDLNRPFTDPGAARQMSQSQQPPDAAEATPADESQPTDGLSPEFDDPAENLAAENPLAPSDVSLSESPSLADNTDQPEVFGQDVPDALDGSQPAASIESGDDMIGTLDLQPWLPDVMDNAMGNPTDADPSSLAADSSSDETPSFFDSGPSVDPFAASPPPFTGPLVEVSPGLFVYPGFSMPWSTDSAAQPAQASEDFAWLNVALSPPIVAQLADKMLQRMAAKFNRDMDQKLESHTNEVEFIRAAQMRAVYGR
jgi:hypothetical protein